MTEGESASRRANELRQQAAVARARASALDHEAGAWEAGARGERLAAAELTRLPTPWRILNDRLLQPGHSGVNLDHIAIGPPGVFLIDAKHWAGRVTVHDGTLWQHNGSHRSQQPAVDQVCRAASEMERVLGVPVAPLITLTGSSGRSFSTCRVGGVDVVPLRTLRAWLRRQTVILDDQEIDTAVRRIEVAFPPAAPAGSGFELSPFDGTSAPAVGAATIRVRSRTPLQRSRRTGIRKNALSKFVMSLGVLALAPVVLPALASQVSETVGRATAPTPSAPSCQTLTVEKIAAVLGTHVTPGAAQPVDRCAWHHSDAATSAVPVLTLQVYSRPFAGGSRQEPMASAQAGRAFARVPEGQRLAQWTASTPIAQAPFSVNLRYSYPPKATRADRQKADAAALAQVAALAEAFARSASPGL